jgi:hypothetical protein
VASFRLKLNDADHQGDRYEFYASIFWADTGIRYSAGRVSWAEAGPGRIAYIPRPEEVFLSISELIFGDKKQPPPTRAPAVPATGDARTPMPPSADAGTDVFGLNLLSVVARSHTLGCRVRRVRTRVRAVERAVALGRGPPELFCRLCQLPGARVPIALRSRVELRALLRPWAL